MLAQDVDNTELHKLVLTNAAMSGIKTILSSVGTVVAPCSRANLYCRSHSECVFCDAMEVHMTGTCCTYDEISAALRSIPYN